MNDQRFFDLAMKVSASQATAAEQAELEARLATEPALRAELARLEAEAKLAKEVLPLVSAIASREEKEGVNDFPAYARERLQTKVRETYGQSAKAKPAVWRWWLGLAGTMAAVVIVMLAIRTAEPQLVVQVAMLDAAGTARGGDSGELKLLGQAWNNARVESFDQASKAADWEHSLPADAKQPVVKIIYDRAAAEVRVNGRWKGKSFSKTIMVEKGLADALKEARDFINSQSSR